jgi:formylglycine-generating enzyme required for sulfatase activity
MKNIFLALTTIFLISASFKTHSKKGFIPPGTVQINDSLFADECEITNFSWQEYVKSVASIYGKHSKEHLASLPDTLVWLEKGSYNEPYTSYYYWHPAYRNFPLVGVSYEQALAFCKWRTSKVKSLLTTKRDFKNQNFEYRLPTKAEWEYLAETSSYVLENNGRDEKGKYRLNCPRILDTIDVKKNDQGHYPDVTAPVYSYWKNDFGLFNVFGNVAEMVTEKGICKGGGWRTLPEECRVGKDQEYTKPTAWLGFRCVCIVKKNNNS